MIPNVENAIKLIKLLKVNEFSYILGRTNHGDLCLRITKDELDPIFTLDSVPVNKELNAELLKIYGLNA